MSFITEAHLESMGERERAQLHSTHIALGYHPETSDVFYISNTDRQSGTYVAGIQGSGKSGLIENMVAQDIAIGNALMYLDPHANSVDHIIACLPGEAAPRTTVLDMADEVYPFGINVFATHSFTTSIAQAQAVDRVMHIFIVLWPDIMSQQHLPRYLRASTIVLFSNPGSTLVDMHRLLTDDQYRLDKENSRSYG